MGNEISMKTYGIALLLLANLASFASDTQSEIEGYEDKFAAINKERKGLDASDLNKLSDPFFKTKSVTYDSEGNSTASLFELQALLNNKAKINGKWYYVKDKIGEYELSLIKGSSVILANKEQKINLNLKKGENKNVIIKIK
jgi:hypothetical protein